MFDDVKLAGLVRQGRKVECPVCGKCHMSEIYRDFHNSGIGSHIRAKHPELEREVISASKRISKQEKEREESERKEKELRPKRKFTVSGEFLDEVMGELNSLIGCMEAYYIQAGCDKGAMELIGKIENMHMEAKARGETAEGGV